MMNNARFRQWVVLQILSETFPVERGFLAPTIQPLEDQSSCHMLVSLNSSAITTDTIILVVTSELCLQCGPPLFEFRSGAYFPEPQIHLLTRLAKLLRTGLTTQCRITFAAPAPVMGKA